MITAKIILDSVNLNGNRLTTFELRYPKFIHGELMTHRVFSRNASSSRAIPTEKLLEEVNRNELRASPIFWGKNQKGMQAAEELTGEELEDVQYHWQGAAQSAAVWAQSMMEAGAHKQIVNRLLEPFSHINVVVSATEYMNFFGLRLDRAAQPEMRALAIAMWDAYSDSTPLKIGPGEWHLPYVSTFNAGFVDGDMSLVKQSVARCARVSYRSFETGKDSTMEEDIALYDKLLSAQPLHASPAEHQATPDLWRMNRLPAPGCWSTPHEHGNFIGWRQYRKMLSGESLAPLPAEYSKNT